MARVRVVVMSTDLLMKVLGGHDMRSLKSDWPSDAKLVGAEWHLDRRILRLLIESASFDDVPEMMTAPDWNPTFTVTRLAPELIAVIEHFRKEMTDEAT